MTHRTLATVALVLLESGACGNDLPRDRTWEAGPVRYHTRSSDDLVCPDLVGVLEQHLAVINGALGQGLDPATRVEYFKFASQSDLDAHGPCDGAIACTDRNQVMTAAPFHQHELIHAYLFPIGFPPWFLLEGAAVALSCQLSLYERPTADSWRTVMTRDRHDAALYAGGGWLVAHLLVSYAPAKFLQLYAEVPQAADADLVSATFERIYGITLDTAWADVIALTTAPPNCPWECAQPPLNGSSQEHPPPTCGLDDLTRTFDAPTGGGAFVLTSSSPRPIEIGSCGPDNASPGRSAIPPWRDGVAVLGLLRAGSYFLSFDPPSGDLTLAFPASSPLGPECATAIPVDTSRFSVTHVTVPRGTSEIHAAVSVSERPVEIFSNAQAEDTQVDYCGSCGAVACTPIPRSTVVRVTTNGTSFLRVATSGADRSFVTTTIRSLRGP